MKNRIFLLLSIFSTVVFYKSQTISLDQISQCERGNCPNYTTVKDTNNRLDKFTGIWRGTYTDGRIYEFHFTKKENDGGWFNEKFWDRIIGRVIAKNNAGNAIYTSINNNDLNAMSGYYFDKELKKYQMSFTANADCNDGGYVYLSFPDQNNLNQMKLVFMQDMDIIASCPSGYKTVIPDAKAIILTKQ